MWFKNLTLYKLQSPLRETAKGLQEALAAFAWEPAARFEMQRVGWVPPMGRPDAPLTHSVGNFHLLCLHEESKLLPASVIRDALDEKVGEIEHKESRKVRRREKDQLKEEVILDLLPRAFSRHRRTWGYIDARDGWLVVDTASARAAEDFVEHLREALGTLPVALPETRESPQAVMTRWLAEDDVPGDIELGEEAVLEDPRAEGCEVRVKRQDLVAEEMRAHIQAGKRVRTLALTWGERLSCVLDASLVVKRLKFLDMVQEQAAEEETETPEERLDVDFSLMSLELQRFYPRLMELFGGERQGPAEEEHRRSPEGEAATADDDGITGSATPRV